MGDRKNGPTAVVLSRQNVRTLNEIPVASRRMGTLRGAYVALKETAPLELIILASGSELQWAMEVAKELGGAVRVVSMPCFERFERQVDAYKAEVLPACIAKRVAIEAGVPGLWYKYANKVIGTDDFGFSAPGGAVMDAFGINVENLLAIAGALLEEEGKKHARGSTGCRRPARSRQSGRSSSAQLSTHCQASRKGTPGVELSNRCQGFQTIIRVWRTLS